MSIFRRRSGRGEERAESGDRILIVGLGNPGAEHAGSRHNIGFEIGAELTRRWDLPRAKRKFGGLIAEGRTRPGGPRVAVLLPQTYMNASGECVGPARGSLKAPLDRVVVLHDEYARAGLTGLPGLPAPIATRLPPHERLPSATSAGARAARRSMSIARPPSSLGRAPTDPPMASTRPRTTASPMPVPARDRLGAPGTR